MAKKQRKKQPEKPVTPDPMQDTAEDQTKFLRAVGRRMLEIRREKMLTLREFSRLTGLDNSKLAKYEKGQVNFTLLTLRAICRSLEITLSEFWNF